MLREPAQPSSNSPKRVLTTERFYVEEVTRRLPQGGTRTRSIVRHPGAVAVIPLLESGAQPSLPEQLHVCLIANYRVSVNRVLWEIPAGTLEPPEPPLETARRELLEETGFSAASMEPLTQFYLSPGILDEKMHIFVARGLTACDPQREPGEEIENRIIPWTEAIALVLNGKIVDAKTIAALLLYDRLRQA